MWCLFVCFLTVILYRLLLLETFFVELADIKFLMTLLHLSPHGMDYSYS